MRDRVTAECDEYVREPRPFPTDVLRGRLSVWGSPCPADAQGLDVGLADDAGRNPSSPSLVLARCTPKPAGDCRRGPQERYDGSPGARRRSRTSASRRRSAPVRCRTCSGRTVMSSWAATAMACWLRVAPRRRKRETRPAWSASRPSNPGASAGRGSSPRTAGRPRSRAGMLTRTYPVDARA